jgi:hypothetical protein
MYRLRDMVFVPLAHGAAGRAMMSAASPHGRQEKLQ